MNVCNVFKYAVVPIDRILSTEVIKTQIFLILNSQYCSSVTVLTAHVSSDVTGCIRCVPLLSYSFYAEHQTTVAQFC